MELTQVLRGGRQCDEDGTQIIMSRQACHEAANEIERLNLELKKRDKCSFMGPMRDCPTHGDKDAKRLRWLLEHWWFGNDSGVDFGTALTADEVRATIDAAILKTPNVELSGPTAALSPEGPAQTQGSASD